MFDSMDQIIAHVNAHNGAGARYEGIKLQYASLEDYFSAVHRTLLTLGTPIFMSGLHWRDYNAWHLLGMAVVTGVT